MAKIGRSPRISAKKPTQKSVNSVYALFLAKTYNFVSLHPDPGQLTKLALSSNPNSPAPSSGQQISGEKNRRYDRQLRLWGDHGQLALERSRFVNQIRKKCYQHT